MKNEYESNLDENNVVPEKSNLKRNLTFIGVAILSIATITQIYNRNEFEQLSAEADALCLKVDDPKIWTSRNERIKLEKEVDSAIATLYSLAEDAGIDIETLIADSDNNVDAITLVKQTLGYDTTTCENIDNVENNPNEEIQTSEQSNSETNNGDSDNDNASEDTVNNDEPVSNDNEASTSNGNSNDSSNTDSNSNGDSSSNGNGNGDGTTGGGSNGNKTEEPPTTEPNPPSDNNNNETPPNNGNGGNGGTDEVPPNNGTDEVPPPDNGTDTPPPTGETPPEEIVEVIPEITNLEASQTTTNKEVELSWTGDEEIVSYDIWKDGFLYASNIPATDSNPDLDGVQVNFTIPDAEYGLHQYNVMGNYVTTSGESKHVQASISYENYIVPEYSNMNAVSISQTAQDEVEFSWEVIENDPVVIDTDEIILTIDEGTASEQAINVNAGLDNSYSVIVPITYGTHTWEVSSNVYNADTGEDIGTITSQQNSYSSYQIPSIETTSVYETTDVTGLTGTDANIEISYTANAYAQTWDKFEIQDINGNVYATDLNTTDGMTQVKLPYGTNDYIIRGYYTYNGESCYVDSEIITMDVYELSTLTNFTYTTSDLQETTSDVTLNFDYGNNDVVADSIEIFIDGSTTPITLTNEVDNSYSTTIENLAYGTHTAEIVVTPKSNGVTPIKGTTTFNAEFDNYKMPTIETTSVYETTDVTGLTGTDANIEISYNSNAYAQTWERFEVQDMNGTVYAVDSNVTDEITNVQLPYGTNDYIIRGYYTYDGQPCYVDSEPITIDVYALPSVTAFTFTEGDLQETTSDVTLNFSYGNNDIVADSIEIFIDDSTTPITLTNEVDNSYSTTIDNLAYGTHTAEIVVTPKSNGVTPIKGTTTFSFEFTTDTAVTMNSVVATQNVESLTSTITWSANDVGKKIDSYNIYIDDMVTPVASVLPTETSYITNELSVGTHQIKVEAVYETGVASATTELGIIGMPIEIKTLESGQINENAYAADVLVEWTIVNPTHYVIEDFNVTITDTLNVEVFNETYTSADSEFTPNENGVYSTLAPGLLQGIYTINLSVNYLDSTGISVYDTMSIEYEVTGKPYFNSSTTATQTEGTNELVVDLTSADLEPYAQIFDGASIHVSTTSDMSAATEINVNSADIDNVNQTLTVDLTDFMYENNFADGTLYYSVEVFYSNGHNSVETSINSISMTNVCVIDTMNAVQTIDANTFDVSWTNDNQNVTGYNVYVDGVLNNQAPLPANTTSYTTVGDLSSGSHDITVEALYPTVEFSTTMSADIIYVTTVHLNQENFTTAFVSDTAYNQINYIVDEDIDLTGVNTTPITLYGTFDGQGYSITGDEITTSADLLVNNLYGTFKNVTINEVATTTSNQIFGPTKGMTGSTVSNVTVNYPQTGITSTTANSAYGLYNSSFYDCTINGNIDSSQDIYGIYSVSHVENSSVNGNLSANSNVTGIKAKTILNCEINGEYDGTKNIIGIYGTDSVNNSIMNANLNGDNNTNDYVVGIKSGMTINNSIVNGTITGHTHTSNNTYGVRGFEVSNSAGAKITNSVMNGVTINTDTSYNLSENFTDLGSGTSDSINNYTNSLLENQYNRGVPNTTVAPETLAEQTWWTDTVGLDPTIWNFTGLIDGNMPYLQLKTNPTLIYGYHANIRNIEINNPIDTHTIELSWENYGYLPSTGIEIYLDGVLSATVPAGTTSYNIENVDLGTHDVYIKTLGDGIDTISETVSIDIYPTFGDVSATLNTNSTVTLNWNISSLESDITGYNIYMDDSTTPLNESTIPAGTNSYTTDIITATGEHTFAVEALYDNGSVKSSLCSVTIVPTVFLTQSNFTTEFVSDTSTNPVNYVLTEDIDLTGVNTTPITLYGTFDGQGYSITGDEITTSADLLVNNLYGTFKNVTINEVATTTTNQIFGPTKGMTGSTVSNVTVNYPQTGITSTNANSAYGLYNSSFYDCTINGNIDSSQDIYGIYSVSHVENSSVNGNLSANSNATGIKAKTILNCEINGEYSGTQNIIGIYGTESVNNSIMNANLNGYNTNNNYVVGIKSGMTINNSIVNGTITGHTHTSNSTYGVRGFEVPSNAGAKITNSVMNGITINTDDSYNLSENFTDLGSGTSDSINNYTNSLLENQYNRGVPNTTVAPETLAEQTWWTDTVGLDPTIWNFTGLIDGNMPYLQSENNPTLALIYGYHANIRNIEINNPIDTHTIELSWENYGYLPSTGIEIYLDGVLSATVPAGTTSYNIENVDLGTHDIYIKTLGDGIDTISETVSIDIYPTFGDVYATLNTDNSVTINWTMSSLESDITGYNIYMDDSTTPLNESIIPAGTNSYTTDVITATGEHTFAVEALYDNGSVKSSLCSVTIIPTVILTQSNFTTEFVSDTSTNPVNYVLSEDIDLTGVNTTPITLYGSFDGQDYTITGDEITTSADLLVNNLYGTFKNVTINEVATTTTNQIFGPTKGMTGSTVSNVTVNYPQTGITSTSATPAYGLYNSSFYDCTINGNINSSNDIYGIYSVSHVENSSVNGNLSGPQDTTGIQAKTISNCEINGEYDGTKYIIGIYGTESVNNSIMNANLNGYNNTNDYVVGIKSGMTINNSIVNGTITGHTHASNNTYGVRGFEVPNSAGAKITNSVMNGVTINTDTSYNLSENFTDLGSGTSDSINNYTNASLTNQYNRGVPNTTVAPETLADPIWWTDTAGFDPVIWNFSELINSKMPYLNSENVPTLMPIIGLGSRDNNTTNIVDDNTVITITEEESIDENTNTVLKEDLENFKSELTIFYNSLSSEEQSLIESGLEYIKIWLEENINMFNKSNIEEIKSILEPFIQEYNEDEQAFLNKYWKIITDFY